MAVANARAQDSRLLPFRSHRLFSNNSDRHRTHLYTPHASINYYETERDAPHLYTHTPRGWLLLSDAERRSPTSAPGSPSPLLLPPPRLPLIATRCHTPDTRSTRIEGGAVECAGWGAVRSRPKYRRRSIAVEASPSSPDLPTRRCQSRVQWPRVLIPRCERMFAVSPYIAEFFSKILDA